MGLVNTTALLGRKMKIAFNLRMESAILAALDELAKKQGLSRNQLATKIITKYTKKHVTDKK
jgi:predicted HicB family RNase H-like nuclease